MKRFFLSVSVIVAFIFYAFIRQNGNSLNPPAPVLTGSTGDITPVPSSTPGQNDQSTTPGASVNVLPSVTPVQNRGKYRDGTFTGQTFDAFYGNIQVQAVVSGGKLTDVKILQYPNDRRTSIEINSQALPMLREEAISAQTANVDVISGASDTSSAFIQSLGSALRQAI